MTLPNGLRAWLRRLLGIRSPSDMRPSPGPTLPEIIERWRARW